MKSFDVHCPLMGGGLNQYKSRCAARMLDKASKTCYPYCRAKSRKTYEMRILQTPPDGMTRSQQTLDMVAQGMTDSVIAETLGIHRGTVAGYKSRARKRGLLPPVVFGQKG